MLLPKSSSVCIPCFKPVAPRVCLVKPPFLAFFGPDMYLKHSPNYIDSKYIWCSNLCDILILALLIAS